MNILNITIKNNSNNNLSSYNQNNNSKSPRQVRSASIENSNNTVEYNIVDDDMIDVESPNIIENNEIEENNNVKEEYTNNFNIPLIKTISSMLNMNSKRNDSDEKNKEKTNVNKEDELIKKMNDLESNINNIENENKDSIFTSKESIEMNSSLLTTPKDLQNDNNFQTVKTNTAFKNIRLDKDTEEQKINETSNFFNNPRNSPINKNVIEIVNDDKNNNSKDELNNESKQEESKKDEFKDEEPKLIEKKMLTNEEFEAQTKISTQIAMIELGTQIAEIKFKENLKEKRENELTKFYNEIVLDSDSLQELFENEFNLEDYIENLEEENKETFDKIGIKNPKMKNEFIKFLIAYSILNKKLEESNEKIEEIQQDLDDREEELEDNIKELDEKDKIIEKDNARILFLEDRLYVVKKYYHIKKNKMLMELGGIIFVSNLLNFTINRYGINYHIKVLYSTLFNILYLIKGIFKLITMISYFMFSNVFNLQIVYFFIFCLGMIQFYQLTKSFVEKKFNFKIDFENKIIENIQRLNCFNKPKKD